MTCAFELENQPYCAGFRQLASNGIDLPVLNTSRMFGKMSGQCVGVQSSSAADLDSLLQSGVRGAPDISALAALDKTQLAIMRWNYHDDDVPGLTADIELFIDGLPLEKGAVNMSHFGIDASRSNAFTAWKRMGSPQQPTSAQIAQLEEAAQLALLVAPESAVVERRSLQTTLKLPR